MKTVGYIDLETGIGYDTKEDKDAAVKLRVDKARKEEKENRQEQVFNALFKTLKKLEE